MGEQQRKQICRKSPDENETVEEFFYDKNETASEKHDSKDDNSGKDDN